jgi:hypothetical protein
MKWEKQEYKIIYIYNVIMIIFKINAKGKNNPGKKYQNTNCSFH